MLWHHQLMKPSEILLKKILFLSKGEKASSTRYRALQFTPLFCAAGFEVVHARVSGGVGISFLRALIGAARADLVVILRKTFPFPLLWLLRRSSHRLVFDFDDSIFCNTDGSASMTRMKRFSNMVKACDHVFAGNEFLSEAASALNPAVTLIPTCVDLDRYTSEVTKPQNSITLVWIGSSSTKKYLSELIPALRLAAARIPSLRIKIIADFDLPEAGFPTVAVPWSAATEVGELSSSHIGIAPMHDDDWSRGKCALKILQYMAVGLPVISSAVGANAEVVESDRNGYLATSDAEWCERILELAENPDLRTRLGSEGRAKVQREYSLKPVFSRMISVLNHLLSDGKRVGAATMISTPPERPKR